MSKRSEEPSPGKQGQLINSTERWFDDGCILDMDYLVKAISGIKSKGVRPDLLGSIITHYAFKWLPELSSSSSSAAASEGPPQSATASWMKKRFVVETLIGVLPSEKEAVSCGFLLRLLRTASMVGAEAGIRAELELRAARQLDEASLGDLMIPSFAHTSAMLLDVSLVLRLVAHFSGDESAAVKVAKLVDSYLAEAAVDVNLTVCDFVALASALPCHSRTLDDGLYRAIDTYLKAHPKLAKQERKSLCRLIDSRKLSPEAALHAAHNERLPVRVVIQVLFSKNNTVAPSLSADWSGSFTATRRHDTEVRRLRDDLLRLQAQFEAMKAHMEILVHHNNIMRKSKKIKMSKYQSPHGGAPSSVSSAFGFFRWKKFGFVRSSMKSTSTVATATTMNKVVQDDVIGPFDGHTPLNVNMKTRLVRGPPNWRRSIS